MIGFLALDSLAAARGDGLRPELRRLLETRTRRAADASVVDLDAYRPGGPCISGPPAPAGSANDPAIARLDEFRNREPGSATPTIQRRNS